MLKQILEYQFNIQGRAIDRSGQNNHGLSTATAGSFGPGNIQAVGFISPSSRIDIPYQTCWSHLNAVQVEIRVLIKELPHRVNLIEIERSLALFIRHDGVVTMTYYAPDEPDIDDPFNEIDSFTAIPVPSGSIDPFDTLTSNPPPPFTWVGVNTDTNFSPDGLRRAVPLNQYVTIKAIHDGIATMRIYIDGELAGERIDVDHGVPRLLAPGIVAVGAWPHDDRYTLIGNIDFLRVWRDDPEFPYNQFFCRQMSAKAQKCWHGMLKGLAAQFDDPDTKPAVRELLECTANLQRSLEHAIATSDEETRQELHNLSEEYMRFWCMNKIDQAAMALYIKEFISLIESVAPGVLQDSLSKLITCFSNPKVRNLYCLAEDISSCDPGWRGYIETLIDLTNDLIGFPVPGGKECIKSCEQHEDIDQECDQSNENRGATTHKGERDAY